MHLYTLQKPLIIPVVFRATDNPCSSVLRDDTKKRRVIGRVVSALMAKVKEQEKRARKLYA